jgi:hypothetical protein
VPANSTVICAIDTSGKELLLTVRGTTLIDALSLLRQASDPAVLVASSQLPACRPQSLLRN